MARSWAGIYPADAEEPAFYEEIITRNGQSALDPLQQGLARQIRTRLWHGEQRIEAEERLLVENLSFVPELRRMLATAGLSQLDVRDGDTDQRVTLDSTSTVFIARKDCAAISDFLKPIVVD